MKTKLNKKRNAGIFIVPLVWWGVIAAGLIIPPVIIGAVLLIVSLLFTEMEPPIPPPIGPSPEEMQSPVDRCDCGGNCLEVEP